MTDTSTPDNVTPLRLVPDLPPQALETLTPVEEQFMDTPIPEDGPFQTLEDWLEYGRQMNWISAVYCGTHDCPPYTTVEESLMDEYGEPPCSWHVRVWNEGRPVEVHGGREGW